MTPAVRRAPLVLRSSFVLGCVTAACSPPSNGSRATEGPGPLVEPERAASDAQVESPDFASCTYDSDCIAVPGSGCCGPGAWVSVNRGRAADYASAGCHDRTPTCPQIILIGPRVPECDNATHTCSLTAISSIACGGFVRNGNPHRCPEDYLCEHRNRILDLPGVCVSVGDAQSTD
jgi:hypothetical protein